jgi:RNA polymerase sigma factor (sigma-70 family)
MEQGRAATADVENVYRTHGHHVLRRATRILGNDADAREVLQEVFLSLLAHPSQFSGASSLTTWLYSSTTHACLNRLRNERTRARLLEAHGPSVPSSKASPDDALEVQRLLARLPDELARVAIHYYLDEMTQEEIASMLGCSRKHVGRLLVRIDEAVSSEVAG